MLSHKKNRWELQQEGFAALLAALSPDPHLAGEKYETLRLKLIRFFRERGCPLPEDLTDQTMDRLAIKLVEGEQIENINSYAFGFAKNILREYQNKTLPTQSSFDEEPQLEGILAKQRMTARIDDESAEQERMMQFLDRCIAKLGLKDQELILNYYHGEKPKDTRKRLAEECGTSVAILATKACRIREKLQACVKECLGELSGRM